MSNPEEAKIIIKEILSREEFSGGGLSLFYTTVMNLLNYLLTFIYEIWLVLVVLSVLALGAIFYSMARFLKKNYKMPEINGSAPGQKDKGITAGEALKLAREAESSGSYRDGLRLLLLSIILELDAGRVITYRPSRTNGEYLQELREAGFGGYPLFYELVILFEKTWYGRNYCGAGEYSVGFGLYRQLHRGGAGEQRTVHRGRAGDKETVPGGRAGEKEIVHSGGIEEKEIVPAGGPGEQGAVHRDRAGEQGAEEQGAGEQGAGEQGTAGYRGGGLT